MGRRVGGGGSNERGDFESRGGGVTYHQEVLFLCMLVCLHHAKKKTDNYGNIHTYVENKTHHAVHTLHYSVFWHAYTYIKYLIKQYLLSLPVKIHFFTRFYAFHKDRCPWDQDCFCQCFVQKTCAFCMLMSISFIPNVPRLIRPGYLPSQDWYDRLILIKQSSF